MEATNRAIDSVEKYEREGIEHAYVIVDAFRDLQAYKGLVLSPGGFGSLETRLPGPAVLIADPSLNESERLLPAGRAADGLAYTKGPNTILMSLEEK